MGATYLTDTTKTAAQVEREEQALATAQAELSEIQRQIDSPQLDVDLTDAACTALGAKAMATRMRVRQAEARVTAAREAHRMAVEAVDRTRFRAIEDGIAETARLLEKELATAAKWRSRGAEVSSRIDQIVASNHEQHAQLVALATKLGETVRTKPINPAIVRAMAVSIISKGEHASYPANSMRYLLDAHPEAIDLAVCQTVNHTQPKPFNLSAEETAEILLRTLDPDAPLIESGRRVEEMAAPARELEARRVAALQQCIDHNEQQRYRELDGTPEQRLRVILEERAKRDAANRARGVQSFAGSTN